MKKIAKFLEEALFPTPVIFTLFVMWAAFIYVVFYIVNQYYATPFADIKELLKFGYYALCTFALGALLYVYNKKNNFLRLRIILVSIFILPVFLSSLNFYLHDFSVLRGGNIVKEDTKITFVPHGESYEDKEVLFFEDVPIPNTEYVLNQLPAEVAGHFDKMTWFLGMFNLEKNVFITIFGAILFWLVLSGIGATAFFRKNVDEKLPIENRLLSFFLGAIPVSLLIFALVQAGIYKATVFFPILAVLCAIAYRQIWDSAKFLWNYKFQLKGNLRAQLAIISGLILIFAMTAVDMIHAVPIAWDDTNFYMRGAKLLAELNYFPQGAGPTAWMNLQSITWLIWNIPHPSLSLLFATAAVGLGIFLAIAKRFLKSDTHTLLATIFLFSIPMLDFFFFIDTKTEIPLLFCQGASILAWIKWREDKEHGGDKSPINKYLLLSILLCAFAVTIKITSITFAGIIVLATVFVETRFKYLSAAFYFLILAYFGLSHQMLTLNAFGLSSDILTKLILTAFLICLAASIIKEKFWSEPRKFFPAIYFCIGLFVLMAPWSISQVIDAGFIDFSNLLFGHKSFPDFLASDYVPSGECSTSNLSIIADYKRYTGNGEGLKALLLFPFNATMTLDLKTFLADITPIFLSILPLWLFFPKKIFAKNSKTVFFAVFSLLFLTLWSLIASGVYWYGIVMLIPACIFLVLTFDQKEKFWRVTIGIFIGISLFANFLLRSNIFAEIFHFSYAVGLQNAEVLTEAFYPGALEIAEILRTAEKEKPVNIYRLGTQIKFFLPVPDNRFLDDDFLDQFTCIAQGRTNEEIKSAFERSDFTHVLLHTHVGLGADTYQAVYQEKVAQLKLFLIGSGWPVLYDNHGILLYKVK